MSIFWIIIFILFSLIILGTFAWTLWLLIQQKSAWAQLAKKHKLRYRRNKFLMSPTVKGRLGPYTLSLFSTEYESGPRGTTRHMSVIELELNVSMPLSFAFSNKGMADIVDQLSFQKTVVPNNTKWQADFIAVTNAPPAMEAYITEKRLDLLVPFLSRKNSSCILISNGEDTLLRLDTPEPLSDLSELEALISQMKTIADGMLLEQGEDNLLSNLKEKHKEKSTFKLEEKNHTIENEGYSGLELEDDETEVNAEVTEPEKKEERDKAPSSPDKE